MLKRYIIPTSWTQTRQFKKHGRLWKISVIKIKQRKYEINSRWLTVQWFLTAHLLITHSMSFFANIALNLAKKISNQNISPLHFTNDPLVNSIFLSLATSKETMEIWTHQRTVQRDMMKLEPKHQNLCFLISLNHLHIYAICQSVRVYFLPNWR